MRSTACCDGTWAPEGDHFEAVPLPAPVPGLHLQADGPAPAAACVVEQGLIERAAEGGAVSALWEPLPALVVPGSYRRFKQFDAACALSAAQGWPVSVRRSGGGLVPQGAGTVNLSLAWRTRARMGDAMEAVYTRLCGLLQQAIRPFGLATTLQAVQGSFCDGRFNLAVGGRKVAGTAQYWRRLSASEHVVLAHACLMVEADLAGLTAQANAFEAALGSGRVYRVEAIANLVPAPHDRPLAVDGLPLNTSNMLYLLGEATRLGDVLC